MITPRELELIRAERVKLQVTEVQVYRNLRDGDDLEESSPVGSAFCRINPMFGQFERVAERKQGVSFYNATFDVGSDVRPNDTLFDVYGRKFYVRDVLEGKTYQTALRALLEGVEHG